MAAWDRVRKAAASRGRRPAAWLALLCAAAPGDGVPARAELPLFAEHAGRFPSLVEIAVGGGRPIPISFDTGSTGLYVMARDVGPDLERTGTPIHQGFVDGTRFEGYVGLTPVAFPRAGIATAGRIAVGVITRVFCSEERPNCPGSDTKPGVMGVDLAAEGQVFSPLLQLPGTLRSGFVVEARDGVRPRVILGAMPDIARGFRFMPLDPLPAAHAGIASWDSGSVRGCYGVNGAAASCQPVIFDTGQTNSVFDGDAVPNMRLGPHGYLLPGQRFTLRVDGALALSVPIDPSIYVLAARTRRSNIGQLVFRSTAVAFDPVLGRIGFRQ